VRYAFIKRERSQFTIKGMCRALKVSRSGFYDWLKRQPSHRAKEDGVLLEQIQRVHTDSRENYGIIKCWKALNMEGITCGRDRVARLRRAHQIYAKRRKRFVVTTRSKHRHWIAPNRLRRNFTAKSPDRTWVGDVTYVATGRGWLYLAVLLDLYSRKVVGWSMSHSNNGELVQDALKMAIDQRQPSQGLVHHSDRGSTYAMQGYRHLMDEHGITSSMSQKGDCWDNAVAESFFSNLKNELVYWCRFANRDQARAAIFDYIEVFYNRKRLHQTNNYLSPEQFERLYDVAS